MALQFHTTHRSVIQCLRNSGISLPWLGGDSLIWRVLRNFYNSLVFLIVVYQMLIAIMSAIILPDFDGKCRAGALISVTSNPTVISLYYALYHKRIQKFFEQSDNLNQQILDSELGETEYFKTIYLKSAKRVNVLTVTIVMFIFMTPIIYNIPRPIIELYNHEYRNTQPVYLYYPFNVHLPGTYEVTFLLQTLSLLCGDIKKFANDCFFLALFRVQTVYLKYLSASIKDLGEQFKTSDNAVIRRKMINWINLHDQFIRNFNELMDLYTPVICIYKVNLICIVVLCIFTQLQEKKYGWIEGSGFAGFFMANIFQLYLQCETNDQFSVEAENLSLEIYKTPWYEIDKSNKDMLKTTLLMASRPVEITAFKSPMLRLNKETFLAFVGSTITAVMTFKEMSDLRQ